MNKLSFTSLITLLLITVLGFCIAIPQQAKAELITTDSGSNSVSKNSIDSWKKVKYENWTMYVPTSTDKRCANQEKMLKENGLPVKIFSYLMWRESRCTTKSIGWNYKSGKSFKNCSPAPFAQYKKCKAISSYDSGLLQINSSWVTVTSQVCRSNWGDMTVLLKPNCNLKVAKFLLDNGGLSHWGAKASR